MSSERQSGYTDVRLILVDEASFWPPHQVAEMMGVVSGYISKPNSQSQIVFCSTPNKPGDLMHQIMMTEPEKDSLYYRLSFDYKFGLEGPYPIYSQQEIDEAMRSREFPREMMLQFVGVVGNVFSQLSIDNATKIQYDPTIINQNAKKSIGVDAGFGSSNFAICVTQFVDGKIQIIFAEEYERPNFAAMINRIWEIKQKCGYISNIYTDAANPEIWCDVWYDNQYVRDQFAYCKKYNLHIEDRMVVVPVPFSVEGAHMLQHAKWLMEETDEDGSSLIAIDKRFDKLITGLRTAVANEYKLDKEATSFDDLVDALGLALIFYKMSKE
jgi:hypothetical protein